MDTSESKIFFKIEIGFQKICLFLGYSTQYINYIVDIAITGKKHLIIIDISIQIPYVY